MRAHVLPVVLLLWPALLRGQQPDSLVDERVVHMISLSEVVVRSGLDPAAFLERVRQDTTFYKAFRTLRTVGYTSLNDIRMLDRRGRVQASLQSKTIQHRHGGCRTMDKISETTTGDFYDRRGRYNYYTAELYASLFLTEGQVCGETNIVRDSRFSPGSKHGLEKHQEQLEMLFFDPGKRIPGVPFIGNKLNLFDPEVAKYYDFRIDYGDSEGEPCYIFRVQARADLDASDRDQVVLDQMTTWFSTRTMEVMARNYDLSFDAGVYDFAVHMEVRMGRFGDLLVPRVLRYQGNWSVWLKKRERGLFTATLFDFTPDAP
ncbi:MAG TPA: hypothetical protein VG870_01400 [Chitinophagaceae bacterium]|nr:hypothetical protein [Chitinophagaceae bacterium]